MNKAIVRLIKKGILFSIPLGTLFLGAVLLLYKSGEIRAIDKTITLQTNLKEPTLFGLAYSYPVKYYKLQSSIQHKPSILVLGSSRTMQFRSTFFLPEYSFYNAGGAVNKVRFFRLFLQSLKEDALPKIILMGIDQWWFNSKWDDLKTRQFDADLQAPTNDIRIILKNWNQVYLDSFSGKINPTALFQTDSVRRVGLSAWMQNHGFRNDGSYYYGNISEFTPQEKRFAKQNNMLANKTSWFLPCETINPLAVQELNSFLTFCENKGIEVVGFLPPYASSILEKTKKQKEDYPNIYGLYSHLSPFFKQHQFTLLDYTDIRKVGGNDNEMIDGTHGSERLYLKMIRDMGSKSAINPYLNHSILDSASRHLNSNFDVFHYNF